MTEVNPDYLTQFGVDIPNAPVNLFEEFSVVEITLMESMMTPSLQTRIVCQSYRHNGYVKDWDKLAGEKLIMKIQRNILRDHGVEHILDLEQTIFKVSERKPKSKEIDELTITACDDTLLKNASRRMNKSWQCTTPSAIVRDALVNCVGAKRVRVEPASPPRTYFAENIHPYQVIAQQADVALASSDDPSFFHFMTYQNLGMHHFRSLKKMTSQKITRASDHSDPEFKDGLFKYKEKTGIDTTFGKPDTILAYEFPEDFDILSDLMNGVDQDGVDQNSLVILNPFTGLHSILGGANAGCGVGGSQQAQSFTDKGSAQGCEIDVEKHRLKRQARVDLLGKDSVALRMTVAWNPNLNTGKMIGVEFKNKILDETGKVIRTEKDYGSGEYLITALTHNIKPGGFSTTIIDCVSKSVGKGGSSR